jgi:hypothetical protein
MSRVSATIPTNETDTEIFYRATTVLRKYLSKHETQSRRLEHEHNIKLYSQEGLTPSKP